jgi:hypothetical protein
MLTYYKIDVHICPGFSIFYRTHNFSSHRNCGIVALMVLGWSANIRKVAKNHKGYGSAAKELIAC